MLPVLRTARRHLGALALACVVTVRRHFSYAPIQLAACALAICGVSAVSHALGHPLHPAALAPLGLMGATSFTDITTTAVADVQCTFKRAYLMAVNAIPDATPLTAQLNRTRKFKGTPDGLYFNAKLQTGGAIANVPDGKLLPRPTRPKRAQGKAGLAHTYTVVAVGGQGIPLTQDTKNAFVSELEDQLEDGMTRVKNDLERQYNGDGRGVLCLIETVGSAPTYGVNQPYGATLPGSSNALGTMLLVEDMDVAILNPANGTERGRAKISSIDTVNDVVTLSASVSGAAIGDYVVLCNDVGATGTDQSNNYLAEATGIQAVVAKGNVFENIDGAVYRRWNASVIDAGGAAWSEKLDATLLAQIRATSGATPSIRYTTRGISISMQDTLAQRRRFTGETMKLKGGYDGVEVNGMTVLEGDWCPKGSYYQLNTEKDSVGMIDVVKMGYVDLDGAQLHRIEGRHAYRADLYFAHNAIWFKRNAQGVAKNLADDLTITR